MENEKAPELTVDQKMRLVVAHRDALQARVSDDEIQQQAKESTKTVVDAFNKLKTTGDEISIELGLKGNWIFDLNKLIIKRG